MPIYEYRCDNCAHEFETIQKLSEVPLKTCPACSTDALRKKISAAGFRLKGGGWYETDFKAGSKRNVAGDDKGGSKDSGDKASGNGREKSSGGDSGGTASNSSSGGDSGKSGSDSGKSGGDSGKSGGDSKSGASKSGTSS